MGAGDLRMKDIINMDESKATNLFKNRFVKYKKLVEEMGEKAANEKMMEKYPEQQKAIMGNFIDNNTLAKGFSKSVPFFRLMGFVTEVVDISQNGMDAVLEIQRVCPVLNMAKEYGFDTPCHVVCEMEQEATRRAFPGMTASIISKQAEGDCICVFKYERPAKTAIETKTERPNIWFQILDLIKLAPVLIIAILRVAIRRFFSIVTKPKKYN